MKAPTPAAALKRIYSLMESHIPDCPVLTTENVHSVLQTFLLQVAPPAEVVARATSPQPGVTATESSASTPAAAASQDTLEAAIALIDTLPFPPTDDQRDAWGKLARWLLNSEKFSPYFILGGYAGTGKTTLMQLLTRVAGPYRFVYTAPTNKAARVISQVLGVNAVTTYSALKLKLVENMDSEDPEDQGPTIEPTGHPLDFNADTVLLIDETSMVSRTLLPYVQDAAAAYGARVIFVGDPAQLPPVKETMSAAWRVTDDQEVRAFLSTVRRFDNHILTLCTEIRQRIKSRDYVSALPPVDGPGVQRLSRSNFLQHALADATPSTFTTRKIIAWRNRTVDAYNEGIRSHFGFTEPYEVGDALMFASPFVDSSGTVLATVDDEVEVTKVAEDVRTLQLPGAKRKTVLDVWRLTVSGDINNTIFVAQSSSQLQEVLQSWASAIRKLPVGARREQWDQFFAFKGTIPRMRYAYAITAHRSQGSTLDAAYVDMGDILANPHTPTALRCLYVAFSRPRHSLFVV